MTYVKGEDTAQQFLYKEPQDEAKYEWSSW